MLPNTTQNYFKQRSLLYAIWPCNYHNYPVNSPNKWQNPHHCDFTVASEIHKCRHTALDSLFKSCFGQTPIDFLERQSAGTQRLMSSFIVSDPSRLIRLQQDKNGQSGCNVAVILHVTWCSKATKLDKEDKTQVTRGSCTVTSDRIQRPTHCL